MPADPHEYWEKTRKMGREAYVWTYGVCYWGLFTAIGFAVLFPVAFWFIERPSRSFFELLCYAAVGGSSFSHSVGTSGVYGCGLRKNRNTWQRETRTT